MEGRSTEEIGEIKLIFREFTKTDFNYILKTWITDFKKSPWAGVIVNNLYYKVYGETIRQLFNRGMKVKLLVSPDIPDLVLGFVAYETKPEETVLHYLYVIDKLRNRGYGSALLKHIGLDPKKPITHTFRTFDFLEYFSGKLHRPMIARRKDL